MFLPMARRPARPDPADDDPIVDVRMLTPGELHAAAAVLARGMHDNPLHVKVFGAGPDRRARRLSRFLGHLAGHVQSNGDLLGAFVRGELVGVLGMMEPGRCRPAPMDALRLARAIMVDNPPATVLRVARWLSAWARNDPADPHWHIGPFAVSPGYRRRGIGRRLMMRCCARIDALAATACLETDLAGNAGFYQTFGFVVTRHAPVLEVPNWFMLRPATQRSPVASTAAPQG
jgi:ribosomal protein S18 acetylase RimI-like enzyme